MQYTSTYIDQVPLDKIREIIRGQPNKYKILADWISDNKLNIISLNLTKDELDGIRPFLRYVNLNNFPFQNMGSAEIQQFLQRFSLAETLIINNLDLRSLVLNLKNLTSLKCTKCIGIFQFEINNLQELILYECAEVSTLSMNMDKLQSLTYIRCNGLRTVPNNLNNLQSLTCIRCYRLSTLPNNLNNLKELNLGFCIRLQALPEGLNALKELRLFENDDLVISREILPANVNISPNVFWLS